jgi:hypothetical protein
MDSVVFNRPMDLGIKLAGEPSEMSPRTPLAAAAYARALPGLHATYKQAGNDRSYNVVGGAPNNTVGTNITGATIGGGGGLLGIPQDPIGNSITADWGTIGGGALNTVSGGTSTIAGGYQNSAEGSDTFIGGGILNTTIGNQSVIGGGNNNIAEGYRAAVCGGHRNEATGIRSAILGGYDGVASGEGSAIGGGYSNYATGDYSVVPGGWHNYATGNYSVAMGFRAQAEHKGSFVWNDSSGTGYLPTTGPNQFFARASGGFRLVTSAQSVVTTAGVELTSGSGTWADLSSKASKTAFEPIDKKGYLEKVAALPLTKWSYRTEDPSISHVGPMAEDFHAAFGHGANNRTITTIDADGVALAAIQGLYELVKEQQAEIQRLKRLMSNE